MGNEHLFFDESLNEELERFNIKLRVCKYCGQEFQTNHRSRLFCLEKDGIKNFCKDEHNRKLKKDRLAIKTAKEENRPIPEKYIYEETPAQVRLRTLMEGKQELLISSDDLLVHEIDDETDVVHITKVPGTNSYLLQVGGFNIAYHELNQKTKQRTFKITRI